MRKFRDWDTFSRYKEGRWPLYCVDGAIMFIDRGLEHNVSKEWRLYERLVQACEAYYRQKRQESEPG